MSRLAGISLIVGAVMGMVSACLLCCPGVSRTQMKAFPRHRFAGALLTCIALSWCAVLLMRTNLGFLEKYKPLLMVIAPLICILIIFFVEDQLAARALGGLLLLVPAPILESARWHESAWRYFAIISAYIMVLKGISLILSPYLFRKWIERFIKSDASARIWGAAGLAYSLTWIVLAFAAY